MNAEKSTKETTKVMFCGCEHEFQDRKYGKNKRLHNATQKGNKSVYRCTVCGAEHSG